MKKRNIIIALLILFIALLITTVNAADEACLISATADKTTLNPGDTVTIKLIMSNVKKTDGISQFIGVLDFSDDIFEIVPDNDESLKADYQAYSNYDILYSGRQNEEEQNPWYTVYVKEEEQKGIFSSVDTAFSNNIQSVKPGDSKTVGEIKLKVKDSAKGTTTIKITDMEVYDKNSADTNNGSSEGDKISDAAVTLTINEKTSTSGTTTVGTQGTTQQQNQQSQAQGSTIQKQNTTDNKAKNDVPYTGAKEEISAIVIVLLITVLAYIKYNKYKNV